MTNKSILFTIIVLLIFQWLVILYAIIPLFKFKEKVVWALYIVEGFWLSVFFIKTILSIHKYRISINLIKNIGSITDYLGIWAILSEKSTLISILFMPILIIVNKYTKRNQIIIDSEREQLSGFKY